MTLDEIKSKELKFPENNPLTNVLYIQHPVKPNTYIRFEEHELEIIHDKIMDFALLVQMLGAKELKVETENASTSITSYVSKFTAKLKLDFFSKSVDADYARSRDEEYMEHLSQQFKIHQKYCPKVSFTEPDDILWLKSEQKWQQLILQRKRGISHWEESFETNKMKRFSSSKYDSIKANFEGLLVDVKAGGDCLRESQFFYNSNVKISVKVYFASDEEIKTQKFTYTGIDGAITLGGDILEKGLQTAKDFYSPTNTAVQGGIGIANKTLDLIGKFIDKKNDKSVDSNNSKVISAVSSQDNENYGGENDVLTLPENHSNTANFVSTPIPQNTNTLLSSFTSDEKEYLEEVKVYIADGKISANDRECLEDLRKDLGISVERATELEASIVLNTDEQKYFDFVFKRLDDGIIDEKERGFLDRRKESLGISASRAKEIEDMAFAKRGLK